MVAGLAVATVQAEEKASRAFVVVSAEVNPLVEQDAATQPKTFSLHVNDYEEFGGVSVGGPKPPSSEVVAQAVQAVLPEIGLEPVAAGATPDLVIACDWGEISPEGSDRKFQGNPVGHITRMTALLYGRTAPRAFIKGWERAQLQEAGTRSRYFVMVTAYDGAAMAEGRKQIRWQTRMSTDALSARGGEQVWTALVDAGDEFFGSNLTKPELAWGTGMGDVVVANEAPSPDLSAVGGRLEFSFL